MVQPAAHRPGNDPADHLDLPRLGRVPVQRLVSPALVAVGDVLTQDAAKMPVFPGSHVVRAFPAGLPLIASAAPLDWSIVAYLPLLGRETDGAVIPAGGQTLRMYPFGVAN